MAPSTVARTLPAGSHKCPAGSGWGTVVSIGTFLKQSKETVGQLLRDLRYQRGRMDYFRLLQARDRIPSSRGTIQGIKLRLHEIGKSARLGTGIGVGVSCIDGVFDFAWPL